MVSQAAPDLAPAVGARVEAIWKREAARSVRPMHNGEVFSVGRWDGARVLGWMAEYKWLMAQQREPELFDVLCVRPLAVTGVTVSQDGVLIGRRHREARQDGGLWELVPAGSVDRGCVSAECRIDLACQLVTELEEECGIARADLVEVPVPFAAVEDAGSRVIDVGLVARTRLGSAGIMRRLARVSMPEHDAFDIISFADLPGRSLDLAPVSRLLLSNAFGLLGGARSGAQA